MLEYEKKFRSLGKTKVAGIDEVGRGPLCGPVVASSVILPDDIDIPGLTDSKKISPKKGIRFYDEILEKAISVGIGIINEDRIDQINILNATILSMKRALKKFNGFKNKIKIDGQKIFDYNDKTLFVKKGDSESVSIASASILAKTYRDSYMIDQHNRFPYFGWNKNKGYGTKFHLDNINKHGVSELHRKSFLLKKTQTKLEL